MSSTPQASVTRRAALALLSTGAVLPSCTTGGAPSKNEAIPDFLGGDQTPFKPQALHADLEMYDGFGIHRSGSIADSLTADWMADHFSEHGYDVNRQAFPVPDHDALDAQLHVADVKLDLLAQPPYQSLGQTDVTGELVYAGPTGLSGDASGKIILADTPYGRPSSYETKDFRELADLAIEANAKALLIITNGPTSQATSLNIDLHRKYPLTALVAPSIAHELRLMAAGEQMARLITPPTAPERIAENVAATLPRGPRSIVVTTPISGWTHCAGERGPGIAALRALTTWLPRAFRQHTIILSAQSGHEVGHIGAKAFLANSAPPPDHVDLWVHLGAGWAARNWHETTIGLLPLGQSDPQRFLLASPSVSSAVSTAFKGIPGLEQVYPLTEATAAGELKTIHVAGYQNLFGMFASHRYHHVMADRMNCISGDLLEAPLDALRTAMVDTLS